VAQNQGSSHSSASGIGWKVSPLIRVRGRADEKMVYASPAVNDMLNQKGTEFEGKDFFDLVFGQFIPLCSNSY